MVTAYDFVNLSPFDFEELVRDLLQVDLGVVLESFARGRDSGIDLRCAPSDGSSLVVQCKKYEPSSFAALLRDLVKVELPKVRRLAPHRYVVATSVRMTPARKQQIQDALTPF